MEESWVSFLNRFFLGNEVSISDNSRLQVPFLSQEALVVEEIVPGRRGRVRCGGSFWPARCPQPISLLPNTLVRVVGHDNITLLVEPDPVLPDSYFHWSGDRGITVNSCNI